MMSNTNYAIIFIVFYNVFISTILILNRYNFISLADIWFGLMLNLLFIWNILLLYLLIKKIKNEKIR